MGVPVNGPAWCASALSTHPDSVRQLHQDYIDAGADIITANSYASSPHNLDAVGLGDRADELNTLSVQLVREAIENTAPDRSIWIAGSLSSFGIYAFSRRDRPLLPFPVIEESYRRQAHTLAEAGADFLLLEMIPRAGPRRRPPESGTGNGSSCMGGPQLRPHTGRRPSHALRG